MVCTRESTLDNLFYLSPRSTLNNSYNLHFRPFLLRRVHLKRDYKLVCVYLVRREWNVLNHSFIVTVNPLWVDFSFCGLSPKSYDADSSHADHSDDDADRQTPAARPGRGSETRHENLRIRRGKVV